MPRISFSTTDSYVDFDDGTEVNVLRVAIRHDCGVPFKCASGNCGTDRILVLEGAHNLSPLRPKERDRLGNDVDVGYRLACQTYARGDVTIAWNDDAVGAAGRSAEKLRERWLSANDGD